MSSIEEKNYRQFTKPAELHKAVNTLKGLIEGIQIDNKINSEEVEELMNWCYMHQHLEDRHPFRELLPLIREVYSDGIVTEEEAKDILWVCNNFESDSEYYNAITSAIQNLFGIMHGIMADNIITDEEVIALKGWLQEHEFLAGTYPFDEIESLVMTILLDGNISEEERDILKGFFSNFIDIKISYNLNEKELNEIKDKYSLGGICAICQELDFENNMFCFTGESVKAKRKEIAELIESFGGKFNNNVTKKTRYLIVGNKGNPCWVFSCYGRKVEEAVRLRQEGQNITIVNETDFWDVVEDQ